MFTLFRYGLIPVVLFCVVIVTASIDAYSTNAIQKSSWRQTVATVMQSQDFGDVAAKFRGTPNTFPDPHGTVQYVVDGQTYTWQGRGRDMGVTVMTPGDKIKVYYNPKDPRQISTLVLLGAFTGYVILAAALAFLAFYVWFFWLRRFLRRAPPGIPGGDSVATFADPVSERLPSPIEPLGSASGDQHRPAMINDGRRASPFIAGGGAAFGKRVVRPS